jgi:hypothetical protein
VSRADMLEPVSFSFPPELDLAVAQKKDQGPVDELHMQKLSSLIQSIIPVLSIDPALLVLTIPYAEMVSITCNQLVVYLDS